jgi:hypothetical protein
MKKEDLDADPQSMDDRRLSAIARNANHPLSTHAKSELQRRRIKKAELSTEDTAPKVDIDEISVAKLSDYMRASSADAAKPGASARRQDKRIGGQSMADKKIRKKDGHSSTAKVAAESSKIDEISVAKLKKSGKYDGKEAYDEPQSQAKSMMSPLHKARLDKEKADRDRDGKLMNVKSKPKMEGTVKSFSEISKKTAQSYLDKTKDDDAWSGTRKANNRLKGAIHAVGKLRKKESHEGTIPDGQTIMTKKPELKKDDKKKLADIMKMLGRERKAT